MLKKRARLTSSAFNTYFSTGTRIHTPLFTLIYTPLDRFHGAVVVPKKVAKQAVVRNKLRRRVYSVLYSIHTDQALSGVFILIAKPSLREASYEDIRTALKGAIGRTPARPVE